MLMLDERRLGISGLVLFAVVAAAALATRAWFLLDCTAAELPPPLAVQDADPRLPELIHNLETGEGFVLQDEAGALQPTASRAPLYPWMVSWIDRSFPGEAEMQLRWLQAGLGALAAGLLFLFARLAFASRLAGLMAGLLAAVHPFWVAGTAARADGVTAVFLVSACLYFGSAAAIGGNLIAALLFGLALAGAALIRATLLPFAVVGLLWVIFRAGRHPHTGRLVLAAFLGFVGPLLPWMTRNLLTLHDAYPIVDTTYRELWIGNHEGADGGPSRDVPPDKLADQAHGVFEEITKNPAGSLARRFSAGLYYLFGASWFREGRFYDEDPAGWTEPPDLLRRHLSLWFHTALAVLIVLAGLGWRWSYPAHDSSVLLVLAAVLLPLPWLLGHGEGLSGPRLPFDAVLISFAGFALATILHPPRRPV